MEKVRETGREREITEGFINEKADLELNMFLYREAGKEFGVQV